MPRVTCPKCHERVRFDDEDLGQRAPCPSCGRTIVVRDTSDGKPEPLGAARAIQTPANWLRLAASILFVLGVLALAGLLLWGFARWEKAPADARPATRVVIAFLVGYALGLAKLAVIERGAQKMHDRQSHRLAVTAAAFAIFDVLLFPLGIWALVVLLRPDTRKAFARAAKASKSTDDY